MGLIDKHVTLLLTNGDELIAYLDAETETEYVLTIPLITVISDGKMLIRHYSRLTKDDTFIIHKRHVIFCNELAEEYVIKYKEFLEKFNTQVELLNQDNVVSIFNQPNKIIN